MAYPLPLDKAYRLSGTEDEIVVFLFDSRGNFFYIFGTNPTDCLSLILVSDQEYSKEEEAEAMAETIEQYMSKTLTDYGSGVARPKIEEKDSFELKGQFLKELQENIFSGSDNEDANEHIEKVLEIVDLIHVPNITMDQLMLRVFPISLTGAASRWLRNKPTSSIKTWEDLKTKFLNKYCPLDVNNAKDPHYTKDFPLKEEGKTIEEAYYTQFGRPFQGGGYRATAPGYYQRNNANPSYQERRQSIEDTLSKFMSESTKRHEENSNLIKEIRATTDAAIRNQGASIKTLKIQIGQISKVLQERGFGSLPSSTKTNPRDQVKSISTIIEADSYSICRIRLSQYAVSTGQNSKLVYKSRQTTIPFPSRLDNHYCEEEEGNYGPKFMEAYGASHINDTIPRKEKDPGSFTLPCYINNICFDNALVDLGASVNVMPLLTYLNLGLGELTHTRLTVELADRTVKYPKGIDENVLVGIGKFTFPVDFIVLDMPEDIKVPLILGRPFLSTARAKIDVYKRKITLRVGEENIIFKSVKPASSLIRRVYMLSLRERMGLDLEARLMGETLVLNRSLDPFLEDYIELNDLNKPIELKRNQGDDLMPTIKEGEVIEEFRSRDEDLDTGIDDYPSYCDDDKKIHIDYAHNLNFRKYDAYRDEGIGDVIAGEPFLREIGIKAKRFEGIITLYKGDDEVTYQMVRSHPRFKRHTNEQCNKIPPLLKINMLYPSRKIRRIRACTHQRTQKDKAQYAVNELTGEVKGLKKQVHELEIELPGDLKEILTKLDDFTKNVASVQAKLKNLDALPSLLLDVTQALNKFAQVLNSALLNAGDQSVPSADQADTMPAERRRTQTKQPSPIFFKKELKRMLKRKPEQPTTPPATTIIPPVITTTTTQMQSPYLQPPPKSSSQS
ncbi:mitochondrial proton/calcium exchanger protein-like protein isoform X1 [Tanacetum coccineum]